MCSVDCPHLANCVNANAPCCQRCVNNKNHKVDYYRPVPCPYTNPWYPYTPYPYTNPYPIWITCTTSGNADYYTPL